MDTTSVAEHCAAKTPTRKSLVDARITSSGPLIHASCAIIIPSMTLDQFRDSLQNEKPPQDASFALAGLWWDAKGDWTKAHESAQQDEGPDGAWVHAYLHRKEGDASNAAYWYGRAKKPLSRSSFEKEWEEIATALLE